MKLHYLNTSNYCKTSKQIGFFFCIFLLAFLSNKAFSQSAATQMDITGNNSVNTISNNVASYVDPTISVTANGTINGFIVTITDSYFAGDILTYTGALPSGISAVVFNTTTRSLVFNGATSAANWQDLLRRVTLQTTSATCFPESRDVAFIGGSVYLNPLNGHFYQYCATSGSWTAAKAFAETQSYFGREGYLSTISEQSENSFIAILIGQNSWIGCADNYAIINSAVGYTKYASQSNAEGKFHWVTGPEKGTQIRLGNAVAPAVGTVIAGIYQNWSGSEPNDYPTSNTSTLSQEDYGHMYSGTNGLWNDFPNTMSIGSVIEYGGMPNDNLNSQVVFTKSIYINGAPSGTIAGGNVSVCSGGNATLTLSGLSGTVVRWESSLDNFLTAAANIVSTSTTLSLTNITQTNYYRAIVNSNSGCSSLATSSTPVFVSNTIAGNIVAVNNTICPNSQASFTLFGNSGNVLKWQVSTSNTFASAVTDISNTTTSMSYLLSSVGTYYFRALVQNNGCTSVYTTGYTITVTSGTAPVGGVITNAEHCGGSNSGTLTLSGYTGSVQKWQYSIDNGIIWNDVSNTTSTLGYSSISTNRYYRAVITNGTCGLAYSAVGTITVFGTTICKWLGGTSTDWGDVTNWCGGIGDNGLDVVVSSTAPNDLVLDQNRVIGNFDFNSANRIVILGANTLTANSFSGSTSVRNVKTNGIGKLKMNITNNSSLLFPVANSAFNPVTITNNSGSSDNFSVNVLDEVYVNGYNGVAYTTPRITRTWDITKQSANSAQGVGFVFNWNNNENVNVNNPRLYHFNGATWDRQIGTTSSTSNSLTYTGYGGTFSPFAITNYADPLPVSLVSFSAECEIENVVLKWQTYSEHNSSVFKIENSEDGIKWNSIDQVTAAGQSSEIIDYVFLVKNQRGLHYYRLIQKDFDGKESIYGPISSLCSVDEMNISVYPNPTDNDFDVKIESENEGLFTVDFEMEDGKLIDHFEINLVKGMNLIPMQFEGLNSGIYTITIANNDKKHFKKVIVK